MSAFRPQFYVSHREKYSLDGAANGRRSRAQNDSFLVPREEVPGSNPGQGKQLVLFKVSSNTLLQTL